MKNTRLIYIQKLTFTAIFVALYVVSGVYIKINVPPVPFSSLTLFAMMAAIMLGKYLAPVSFAIYVSMGLLGLPVFAKGLSGPSYVFQPSFGYLIGYIIACFVVGLIVEKLKDKSSVKKEALLTSDSKFKNLFIKIKYSYYLKIVLACLIGLTIVYIAGIIYFCCLQSFYFGNAVDFGKVLVSFCLIFIPSDAMWCFLAAFIAIKVKKALKM